MILLENVQVVQVILTLPLDISRLTLMEHTNSHFMPELYVEKICHIRLVSILVRVTSLEQLSLAEGDGNISWTMTSHGHYFPKRATSRAHSQRVTFPGRFWLGLG